MANFFSSLDIWQILPSFVFLVAIIDPLGNMPMVISMEKRGAKISAWRVALASAAILISFLLLGEWIMKLFGIKIEYFAIAGGFIIFLMALELILDIVIFKVDLNGSGNLIPLAFPMYAGPGAFTALLAMTADYTIPNLVCAVLLCIVLVYILLLATDWLSKHLGNTAVYIIRKFFGIIVLAVACQLIFGNLAIVLHNAIFPG